MTCLGKQKVPKARRGGGEVRVGTGSGREVSNRGLAVGNELLGEPEN